MLDVKNNIGNRILRRNFLLGWNFMLRMSAYIANGKETCERNPLHMADIKPLQGGA